MFSSIAKAFSSVFARFSDRGTITERDRTDFLEKITEALIEADVPQQVIDRFIGDMRSVLTVHRFDPKLRPAEQLTKLSV